MKVEKKEINETELELTITVDFEDLKKHIDKALEEATKDLEIKGFRKGQAPKDMVESHVGKEALLHSAAEKAIQEFYPKAIEGMEPIGMPEINITKIADNNPLEFKAKVYLLPEFTIGEYKLDKVKKNEIKIEQKDVDEAFENLEKNKDKLPKEQLEQLDFSKPETIKEIIKQQMERDRTHQEKQRVRTDALGEILKTCDIKVPANLITIELYRTIEDLKKNVDQFLKISFEAYLEQVKKSEEQLRDDLKPEVEGKIKRTLLLKELQKKENITVTDEELKKEIDIFLANFPGDKEKLDMKEVDGYIRERLEQEKTLQYVEDQIK
jgi:FKBP-type peptidyl-prolyl cis-trans isomerase (trigger factor)